MPIFRYTFKKILLSPSTWVIFTLTLITLSIGWFLPPILANDSQNPGVVLNQLFLFSWKKTALYGFITLMLFIFMAVKSVQIFRDEIDDGTLLILVSKPISRNRIWFEKWFSFQSITVGYIVLSVAIPSLLLLVPQIAGPKYFSSLLYYMGILVLIGLIFNLIFSSIILLISLVLNSKAVIALTIGFAALTMIFSQLVDSIVTIPYNYFPISQGVKVYQILEKKIDNDDLIWFNEQKNIYKTDSAQYTNLISDFMKTVYKELIKEVNYPSQYNPVKEKQSLQDIANGKAGPTFEKDKALAKHIINISNVYRQNDEQSYESLMTKNVVPSTDNAAGTARDVDYSVADTFKQLNTVINQSQLDDFNSKIFQKKISRYLNIFYQLTYLFNGIINENNTFSDRYSTDDDPYLISFKETTAGSGKYIADTSVNAKSKIINFPALISIYTLLGISLLGVSWYVFNRRDFA